jgi:hypothetical protein
MGYPASSKAQAKLAKSGGQKPIATVSSAAVLKLPPSVL